MEDKYREEILHLVRTIDNHNGQLEECVCRTLNGDEEAACLLLGLLDKMEVSNQIQQQRVARKMKVALISFYGFQTLNRLSKASQEQDTGKSFEELQAELDNLTGLEKVKNEIKSLICYQKIQRLRRRQGLKVPPRTLHLAFTGNPGTGKTTVARIIGQMYKHLGLLTKGHFIEVSRTDLIAGYQGQTALKVKDVIERAKGGVLFIDEAYSITENEQSDSYGRECLTELTKALEDNRNDLIVIVAGYTEPMQKFFNSNPGLKSRFNNFMEFGNYSSDELLSIFKHMCVDSDYTLSKDTEAHILSTLQTELCKNESQFANARFVRNLYEASILNHANRVAQLVQPSERDLQELLPEDLSIEQKKIV